MKKENLQVSFSLQGIKTEQFALLEDNYNAKKEIHFATELQIKIDQTNKKIGMFLGFEFVHGKKVFIKIVVSCHFKILDESWEKFVHTNEQKLIVPKGFLAHLAMITTGTTRGVLFARLEGTPFAQFIIPTLDVTKMIDVDATHELTSD